MEISEVQITFSFSRPIKFNTTLYLNLIRESSVLPALLFFFFLNPTPKLVYTNRGSRALLVIIFLGWSH